MDTSSAIGDSADESSFSAATGVFQVSSALRSTVGSFPDRDHFSRAPLASDWTISASSASPLAVERSSSDARVLIADPPACFERRAYTSDRDDEARRRGHRTVRTRRIRRGGASRTIVLAIGARAYVPVFIY
ncbi:hypothetical protein [Natrinema soli]|uniref:Uncharacterized protein n=1 Tax=Natrinema soli TaxID=1930624 RepID=A0ABD5SMP1_9EURY|nr:hypothetical protein [Natrinema soli]